MIDALGRLKSYMEREADKLQAELESRFDRILRAQLENWKGRFPRHEFSAFYAHGLLNFQVEPKILGEDDPVYLEEKRGAVGILGKEAKAFIDAWLDMEAKVEPAPLTARVRLEEKAGTL